ncbi:MAG TPA: pseudouridine-5'-phosphate glycosidase, partial [Bellilinea sp.]|nr:pseudouridine-5'-phosphate glycosidase [Bellilinea sp.]
MSHMPPPFKISKEVQDALDNNGPVVALESTVITHGLPHPHNLELARSMERIIRENGATPATVAILDGEIRIGLDDSDLELLAQSDIAYKASRRDFGYVLANKKVGGTTVAGTIYAATQAGIKVFATGGIGGVHRGLPFDVSADLNELSISPIVVVCAGAKAILDIPSTLEYL